MLHSLYKHVTTYKRLYSSLLLFLTVFCLIGVPFTSWWFNGDDFSSIALGKNMQTWKNFWSHVIEGNPCKYFYPSHHNAYTPYGAQTSYTLNFFGVFFRPIHCAYLACAYWLFNLNAYAYYLVSVFLHAFNTTVIFNILTYFTGLVGAFLFSLLFAFHPQIGFRFGAPANFQYYFDLLIILITLLLLKKYLDTKKLPWYLLSCILFLLALFTRETAITLPVIIFFGTYLYEKRNTKYSLESFFKACIRNVNITSGYLICTMFYLGVRMYLYPITQAGSSASLITPIAIWIHKLPNRLEEFLFFFYDYLCLSWLPWGNKNVKLLILAPLLTLFLILFIRNSKKILILFFTFASITILWPCLYLNYSPRYFYEASPWILLTVASLFAFSRISSKSIKNLGLFLLGLSCLFTMGMTLNNLKIREEKLNTLKQGFLALKSDPRITGGTKPLCFVGFPVDGFGTGIEQAAWLYLTTPTNPVYYDPATLITQYDSNVLEHVGWYMRCNHYHTKNFYTFTLLKDRIRLTSLDPQKINFSIDDYLSMGQKIIHETAIVKGKRVVTDFTLVFEKKYLDQKLLIVYWDYEKQRFFCTDL